MAEGGLLTIRTTMFEEAPAGRMIAIAISDSGTGMDADTLDRAFEPFFTTKATGKGTGLGLSQVYGFAFQMGGRAAIRSEPGRGTTVTLYLPRAIPIEAAKPQETAQPALALSNGTILIVEDDDAVAATAARLFELIGYQTIRAADARTALEILLGGQKVEMVFSDVVMPGGMTGIELAHKIHRHFPQQPILLATGYSRAAAETAREGLALIAKPYRVDTLADAVRRTIAGTWQAQRASA
jgi:two-component system NtrC family sensor kinase